MSSNDTTTTVSTRSVLLSQPTEMQNAYNAFAVAVKNHTANPNPKTLKALNAAQAEVYRVEDLYREGRKLRLAHALDQRDKARRS
jgi:hypothetical protein